MNQTSCSRRGFTVVELVVMVAVLGLLGVFLMPGWAQENKARVRAMRCLDNQGQLIKAWQLYAANADEYVVNNYTLPGTQAAVSKWRTTGVCDTWAPNIMDYSGSGTDVTNAALARAGSLVPYHRSIEAYRCPADTYLSAAQRAAGWRNRLRSVSMNSTWGRSDPFESKVGNASSWAYSGAFRQWHRTSEVRQPAERYVFTEEHPDSVNDGFFLVMWGNSTGEYPGTSPSGAWGDSPGFYHNKGGSFAFADGHVEMKKWMSASIPIRGTFVASPAHIADQEWYVRHVAERR